MLFESYLDDYGRWIRDLVKAALRDLGKPADDFVKIVQTQTQPAPNVTLRTPRGDVTFQVDREEVVVSGEAKIPALVRQFVEHAYAPR